MTPKRREKMSAVDTAWLRMDRPDNLMVICALVTFADPVTPAKLVATLRREFLRHARFRQCPVDEGSASHWEVDADFDLDRHVVPVRLRGRGSKAQLQALVSRLASRPFDPAHPRWQFHLVENYAGGSAVILRIHHCYADGIALTQVLLSMTRGKGVRGLVAPRSKRSARADAGAAGVAELRRAMPGVMKLAFKISEVMIAQGVRLWLDPTAAFDLARRGTALAAEVGKLALMTQDSPTRFKGRPGVAKVAAWAEPLPLAAVKAVGKALDASVNDVLLACVAGALRGYLADKGDPVRGVAIRALVPVNLRPPGKALDLGNQFGLVFLELPIGVASPVQRVAAVHAHMDALKSSYQPVLALGLLAAMGAGPKLLQDQLLQALARNATAVMTNVPGPQEPLSLAGGTIDSIQVWVPQSGDIGMGVSILSYNGNVQFGMLTDRKLCPDPAAISDRFGSEFARLEAAVKRRRQPAARPARR